MTGETSNGQGARKVSRLELVFDHDTFGLSITGEIANADCALAICQQAVRYFEQQQRQAGAIQFAHSVREQQRGQALVDQITRGRH